MHHSTDTITTVVKITGASATGLAISVSDVETALRFISLGLGITLSIIAFLRNEKHRKKAAKHSHENKTK